MVLHELVRFGSKRFHEEVRQLMKMVLASVTLILRRSEPMFYGNRYAKDVFISSLESHLKQPRSGLSVRPFLVLFSPIAFLSPV